MSLPQPDWVVIEALVGKAETDRRRAAWPDTPAPMTSQIRVTVDDSPVHCIDVLDTTGQRQWRIRPAKGGITIDPTWPNSAPVWLNADDADELASALSRAARRYPSQQETR